MASNTKGLIYMPYLLIALIALALCGCPVTVTQPSNVLPQFEATPGCSSKISGEFGVGAGFGGGAGLSGRYDIACQGAAPAPPTSAVAPVPAVGP
jgi:hypothetical protein